VCSSQPEPAPARHRETTSPFCACDLTHASTVSGNRFDQMLPFVGTLVLLLFVYLEQGQSIAAASVQGPCELESILPKPILESSLSCIASAAIGGGRRPGTRSRPGWL
jgi:hypothetical protein